MMDYSYPTAEYPSWLPLTIFRVLAPALSRYLVPTYTSLPEDKKVRWDTTVASQCYAVGVSVVTIYVFVADDRLYRDPIWGRWDAVVGLECGVSIGYFLAELVTMFLEPTHLFSVVFLFHHITALVTVIGRGRVQRLCVLPLLSLAARALQHLLQLHQVLHRSQSQEIVTHLRSERNGVYIHLLSH